MMFRKQKTVSDLKFDEKCHIENTIDQLAQSATNPYAASIPLIASAELGDSTRYQSARKKMFDSLTSLSNNPDQFPKWMCNNSFNAWMLGRVLSSAAIMDDEEVVMQAKEKLALLLKSEITADDNFAFFTWAWGYRAALDSIEYRVAREKIMIDAASLSVTYQLSKSHHDLSNALWAWVMNISASAAAKDIETYNKIKEEMKSVTSAFTVTEALEKGLLRTAASNDYPAWALAKVYAAAEIMRDEELSKEINAALLISIKNAKENNQHAEYILAMLGKQIAVVEQQELLMNRQQLSI